MASPTYSNPYPSSALSPPYPASSSLPQASKRRQTDMPSSAPTTKRRKASMLSTTSASSSLHPLRQTSFPPEKSQTPSRFTRSPSVETASVVSGSVAGAASKKRKRKSGVVDDTASTVNGRAKSTDGKGSRGKRGGTREPSVEDEDDGADGDMAVQMVARTQEERQKEMDQRNMLVRSLDPDQFARYEAWRASRLAESVVRRIVNQTISQSAPASVILAIKTVAKIFAGEVVGGAVKVQMEWIKNGADRQNSFKLEEPPVDKDEPRKEVRRAPLTPDHLREALRRYRARREGGLAGHLNLYHAQASSGVERFGVKFEGKRLLK